MRRFYERVRNRTTLARLPADNRLPQLSDQHDTLVRMATAENYNAWLLERSKPFLGRRVLDVGAGIGTFTERLAVLCELVVAVEADPEFARILERRFADHSNVQVVQSEAETPLPGSPFDSIICFNVLEHIAADDEALASFRGQLAPGGALLLLVPAHPRLYGATDRMLGHERRYRRRELRTQLRKAGFSVAVLRHVNPIGAFGWLVSARLLRRRRIPRASLAVFDRTVPFVRHLDRLGLPFGLSLWAVAINRES
jgi:2-polyprenyl-3-methyl-5-hydroxy-6-metoxy-1,4-benzoquinol methylase